MKPKAYSQNRGEIHFFTKDIISKAPPEVKLTTYKNLIRPVLVYADIIWELGPTSTMCNKESRTNSILGSLLCSQNIVTRHTSITNLISKAELPSLEHRGITS